MTNDEFSTNYKFRMTHIDDSLLENVLCLESQ